MEVKPKSIALSLAVVIPIVLLIVVIGLLITSETYDASVEAVSGQMPVTVCETRG